MAMHTQHTAPGGISISALLRLCCFIEEVKQFTLTAAVSVFFRGGGCQNDSKLCS